jgi:DNA-binding transcriptional regulator GbsR (MarR family)
VARAFESLQAYHSFPISFRCLSEISLPLELVIPVHIRRDCKQYYEATQDPWEAFRVILDDHKRWVIDPTVAVFRTYLQEEERIAPDGSHTLQQM